jgi:CheY-like chemotaxis protein
VGILDIGMPGMDGCELARRLRSDPAHARMLLIALTGWGQPDDRLRVSAAGFDHHLLKPVDAEEMLALLQRPRAVA